MTMFIQGREHEAMTWGEICRHSEWQGRWVALDDCAYNEAGEAMAAQVVDVDGNLADLCARVRDQGRKSCSIVWCPRTGQAA
jgi:hypothetical protein